LIHHMDYRSKAEDRRRELEKLQEKGLAKTKAARLRGAPVPTEACNFLEKQRELFAARRKNQADAMKILHQFRADDDFVLRTARRSFGSNNNNYSATHNSTSGYPLSLSKLGRKRQPDARASIYSYAVYPMLTQIVHASTKEHDDTSNESSLLQSPINPPDINKNSICFESAFEALKIAAKEASRQSLPEDDDVGNEYLETAIKTRHSLVDHIDQISIQGDSNDHSEKGEDENKGKEYTTSQFFADEAAHQAPLPASDNKNGCGHIDKRYITAAQLDDGKYNSILILEDEVNDGNVPYRERDCIVAAGSSTDQFIPYEAFSKLGQILVMESHSITQSKEHGVCKSYANDDSDDESIIPGESFVQLGASMISNDLFSLKDGDEEKIILAKELQQYSLESPNLISTTATDLTSSQISIGKKSLSVDVEISERTNNETLDDNSSESVKSVSDHVRSKKKAVIEYESASLESKVDKQKRRLCEDKEVARTEAKIPRNIDGESNIQNAKSMFQSEGCYDDIQKEKAFERSVYVGAAMGDDVFEIIRTPKKLNLSVARHDNKNANCDDGISDEEEKLRESEIQSKVNSEIADLHPILDTPRNPRRNRKKKDKPYYPSSSLFVLRQFLSR